MSKVIRAAAEVVANAATPSPSGENRAPPQGGVIEGGDPSHYDPKNPLILFIIQV